MKATASSPAVRVTAWYKKTPRRTLGIVLPVLAFVLVGACNPFASDPTAVPLRTPQARTPTPPTPTPEVEPEPTATPVPTPTPIPSLSRRDVERLVWAKVSPCAEQIAGAGQAAAAPGQPAGSAVTIQAVITSRYSPLSGAWLVDIANNEPALTFGLWEANDRTGQVIPLDDVARSIASPGIICNLPTATLATSLTPPLFRLSAPTPFSIPPPTPTPEPAVASTEEAALLIWISVYNCYDHFPDQASFAAFQSSPRSWTVEGKSDITHYGLWEVNAFTGAIIPLDELAIEAQATCASRETFPAVVSGEQAQLRVWIAIYDCYPRLIEGVGTTPRPPSDAFTAYQESPIRWVVEGLAETTLEVTVDRPAQGGGTETFTEERTQANSYGLWDVDTNTGAIFPLDQEARDIVDLGGCFRPL